MFFTAVRVERSPPFRGPAGRLDTLRERRDHQFLLNISDAASRTAEFERDINLTMRTLLGRGFSDPAASLFAKTQGFLGIPMRSRCGLAQRKADSPISVRPTGNPLPWRAQLVRKSNELELHSAWQGAQNPSTVTVSLPDERFRHHGLIGAKTGG